MADIAKIPETKEEKKEIQKEIEKEKHADGPYKFHSVDNFRDLADPFAPQGITPNLIFRSASLDVATKEDIEALTKTYSIRTILDLRSKDDVKKYLKKGTFAAFPAQREVRLRARINTAASHVHSHRRRLINRGLSSKTIMINFTGKRYRKYVWSQLDNEDRSKLVMYRLFNKDRAAKLVCSTVLNKGGLAGLYCGFIDYSGGAICLALKVLVSAINYPILIHCAQGKDRTGIVTALALAAIGIDEETIVADYAQSQVGLERIHTKVVTEMAARGLDSCFADAPPEAMKGMFEHIRTKYGGLDRYFDSIKFTEQNRADLKATLLHGAQDFILRIKPRLPEV